MGDEAPYVPVAGAGSKYGRTRTRGDAIRQSSTSLWKCVVLRHLARGRRVLELGTGTGRSTAWMATSARVVRTVDADRSLLVCPSPALGLETTFDEALDGTLRRYEPFDMVYIDGDHKGNRLLHYFETIRAFMPAGGVVAIDDILWSDDMLRAWCKIREGHRARQLLGLGLVYLEKP